VHGQAAGKIAPGTLAAPERVIARYPAFRDAPKMAQTGYF